MQRDPDSAPRSYRGMQVHHPQNGPKQNATTTEVVCSAYEARLSDYMMPLHLFQNIGFLVVALLCFIQVIRCRVVNMRWVVSRALLFCTTVRC